MDEVRRALFLPFGDLLRHLQVITAAVMCVSFAAPVTWMLLIRNHSFFDSHGHCSRFGPLFWFTFAVTSTILLLSLFYSICRSLLVFAGFGGLTHRSATSRFRLLSIYGLCSLLVCIAFLSHNMALYCPAFWFPLIAYLVICNVVFHTTCSARY